MSWRKRKRLRKPKFSFVLEVKHDERTDPWMYHSTEAWFVRHRLYPERTKTFVFGFVFVLAHKQPMSPQNIKYESNRVKIKSLLIWELKWWHLFLLRVIATFGFFLGLFINCRFFETNFLLIAVIVWGRRASLFSFCASSFQNWSRNDWQKRADRIDFLTAKLQSSQNLKSV